MADAFDELVFAGAPLDRAAELADEGGVAGGVLATGSVITAAEVRMLLGEGAADERAR